MILQTCYVIEAEQGPRSNHHDLLSQNLSTVVFDLVALLSLCDCSRAQVRPDKLLPIRLRILHYLRFHRDFKLALRDDIQVFDHLLPFFRGNKLEVTKGLAIVDLVCSFHLYEAIIMNFGLVEYKLTLNVWIQLEHSCHSLYEMF